MVRDDEEIAIDEVQGQIEKFDFVESVEVGSFKQIFLSKMKTGNGYAIISNPKLIPNFHRKIKDSKWLPTKLC